VGGSAAGHAGQVDLIRLDHFRGFEAYWEIPAEMPTARGGAGADRFNPAAHLGKLPLIRGKKKPRPEITPGVEALATNSICPACASWQFAFGGAPEHRFLPHNYDHHTVVYTGHATITTRRAAGTSITERTRSLAALRCPGL